jgi:hypothetical protein
MPIKQSHALCPISVSAVAGFVALEFGRKQVGGRRYEQMQFTKLPARGARFPPGGQFPQHGVRHQIDVPAVRALEFASDERFITMHRHFVTVSDGINKIFRLV